MAQKNVASLTFAFLNYWYFIGKTFLPKLTWRREVAEKVVYLTFDDGPHPTITPWVMEELEKVGAKGTFFMVGDNIRKYPHILDLVYKNGHGEGNHTMHHVKGWDMSAEEYVEDIRRFTDYVADDFGYGLFRPPFGQINFRAMNKICEHYEVIMWDILTKDYLKTLNISRAQKRIRKATRPGSIIVFHDSEKAEKQLKQLLPEYLRFLQSEGYRMEVL